jgi:hypothetical protein
MSTDTFIPPTDPDDQSVVIAKRLVEMRLPPEQRTANKIWADIQNVDLGMYGLPDQFVHKFCTPIFANPLVLRLKYTTSMVLPFLEASLKNKYVFELVAQYIDVVPKETK